MYLDKQLMFSEGQTITSTAASTNIVDLGAGDAGISSLDLLVLVDQTFTAAGAAVLSVSLQTAANTAFANLVTLLTVPSQTLAALTKGKEICKLKLPGGCQRYLRLYYSVGTGPMTAGKISAGLLLDRQTT